MPVQKKQSVFVSFFLTLTYPFNRYLAIFSTVLFFQLIQVYCNVKIIGGSGFVIAVCSIGVAYVLTLPLSWMNVIIIRRIYFTVLLTTSFLIAAVQLFCAIRLNKILVTSDLVIAGDTNLNEAENFLADNITSQYIIALLILIGFAIIIGWLGAKIQKLLKPNKAYSILTVICITALIFSVTSGNIGATGIGIAYSAINFFAKNYQQGYDLSQTETKIVPIDITYNHPQNIILIVGESYDKNHAQLYGYNKHTTPKLCALQADSLIASFNNVMSSAPSTRYSFKLMFSSSSELHDNEWQNKIMLPTTFRNANYKTHWISNQSKYGIYDNIVTHFANLCDNNMFLNESDNTGKTSYDDILIPVFKKELERNKEYNNLYILHLMGSHGKCTDRFPKHFEKFMESDYSDKSKHQRKNYADYDNTVLYNDYVISKLIEQVNPYEAIVLYFPDHGVDFYYTRDDYAGHGIIDNPKSSAAGCQIPFIIYCTQKYNKRFPKTARILRKHIDNKFETCNLIYTVLDIAGYDLPDNSVSLNSLFKGDFLYSK